MKSALRSVVLGVVVGAASAIAPGAAGEQAKTIQATGKPVLVAEQESIDMGPVSDAEPLIRPFTVTNVSDRVVSLAVTYCHFCAPPVLSTTRLKPGEKATVVVEIDGTERKGAVQATVTVLASNVPNASVNLLLTAEIFPRMWLEPRQAFPRVVRGRGASVPVTIIGRGADFKVKAVETGSEHVTAELGPREKGTDQGAECYKVPLTIHFAPTAPLGPLATTVRVLAEDPTTPPREVAVQGQVVGLVTASPETVGGQPEMGGPFSYTFDLLCEDALGMTVDSVETGNPSECTGLVMDVVPTPDPARWRATVSGRAPERPRTAVEVPILFEARSRATGEKETVRALLLMSIPRPKDLPATP